MIQRPVRSLLRFALLVAIAACLHGCVGLSPYSTCYPGYGCYVTAAAQHLYSWRDCADVVADANGEYFVNWPHCEPFLHRNLTPGNTYSICASCADPLVVEWPTAWTLKFATWFSPSASGNILVEDASVYDVPVEYGPLVTDPGMSAHVLQLEVPNLAADMINLSFNFDNAVVPNACLKGFDVQLVTIEPGGIKRMHPTEGLGLDFTAVQGPGLHRICVGPDTTTATTATTWGRLKITYR